MIKQIRSCDAIMLLEMKQKIKKTTMPVVDLPRLSFETKRGTSNCL